MTLTKVLPVVAGGIGANVAVQGLSAKKTIIVDGVTGSVTIEASADGVTFCPVATFIPTDSDKTLVAPAAFMRVRATSGNAAGVQVMAEAGLIRAGVIPAPPVSGPGAALDVSAFGCLSTVFVGTLSAPGSINIEISPDGIDWSQDFKTFTAAGCDTKDVSARFVRAVGVGATASVSFASEEPAISALTQPCPTFVFRPGDPLGARGNIYTDWFALYAALQATKDCGRRYLHWDCSFQPLGPSGVPTFTIPAGTFDMFEVWWTNLPEPFDGVAFADGAIIERLECLEGYGLHIFNDSLVTTPITIGGSGPFGLRPGITFRGVRTEVFNTVVGAKPCIIQGGASSLFSGGQNASGTIGRGNIPPPSPVVDFNEFACNIGDLSLESNTLFNTGGGPVTIGIFQNTPQVMAGRIGNQNWAFPGLVGATYIFRTGIRTSYRFVSTVAALIVVPGGGYQTIYNEIAPISTAAPLAGSVLLPTALGPRGYPIFVKDATGSASVNNITITAQAGQTIDGVLTAKIATDFGGIWFVPNGFGAWWTAGDNLTRFLNEDALGGVAIATLGTIGGTGPMAVAQSKWVQIDVNGVQHWVPAWL